MVCARDVAVNGAPFYVMKFVDGLVLNDSTLTQALTMADRRALGFHVIDVLATLHKLDPDAVGSWRSGPERGVSVAPTESVDETVGSVEDRRDSRDGRNAAAA